MDDDHQITIGIDRALWPRLQAKARTRSKERRWLDGRGSEWDILNIWIIEAASRKPDGMELWQWISQLAME